MSVADAANDCFAPRNSDFRFTPKSGFNTNFAACRKSAMNRHDLLFDHLVGAY
jgi:hypothetical protein